MDFFDQALNNVGCLIKVADLWWYKSASKYALIVKVYRDLMSAQLDFNGAIFDILVDGELRTGLIFYEGEIEFIEESE